MNFNCSTWLSIAFFAGFLAVGLPYWQIPYAKLSLPDTLIGFGLFVVIAAAALSRLKGKTSLFLTIVVVGMAVPSAVFARVIVEAIKDPTSHNLWPIEVGIALFVGLGASSVGVLLGSLPLLFSGRGSADDGDA